MGEGKRRRFNLAAQTRTPDFIHLQTESCGALALNSGTLESCRAAAGGLLLPISDRLVVSITGLPLLPSISALTLVG